MLQYSLLYVVAFTAIIAVKCDTDTSFTCKSKFGAFADKDDCSKFWLCLSGNARHIDCVDGMHFSEKLGYCVKPEEAKCETVKSMTSTATTVESTNKAKLRSRRGVNLPAVGETVTSIRDLLTDDQVATEASIVNDHTDKVTEKKETEKSDSARKDKKEKDAIDVNNVVDDISLLVTEQLNTDSTEEETDNTSKTTEKSTKIIKNVDINADVNVDKKVIVVVDGKDKKSGKENETENKPKKQEKKADEAKIREDQFEMASTEIEDQSSNANEHSTENEDENKLKPVEDDEAPSTEEWIKNKESTSSDEPIEHESNEKSEAEETRSESTIEELSIEEVNENSTRVENATTQSKELPFVCPMPDGMFPHTKSCRLFFHCSNGIPHVKLCPGRLEWSAIGRICEWPEIANCTIEARKPKKLRLLDLSAFIKV